MNADMEQLQAENMELRQRIARLEQSVQSMQTIFGYIHDGIMVFDGDGRYLDIIPTSPNQNSQVRQELLGKRMHEVMGSQQANMFLSLVQGVIQAQEERIVDYKLVDEQGNDVWFTGTITPHRENQVVAIVRDISEQKRLEESLSQQVQLFTNLLATLPFPVFYKDAAGIYRGCNQMFAERMMGRPIDEVVGKGLYELFPPEQAAFYEKVDNDLLQQGGIQVYERDIRFADGTTHTILFHKSVYYQPDGSPGGIIGAMVDMTERKQAEDELAIFKTVFENAPDGFTLSTEDAIVYTNQAFRTMTGYGDDLIGLHPIALADPDEVPRARDELLPCIRGDGYWRGTVRMRHRDGTPWITHLTGMRVESKEICRAGIWRDVTEQLRVENERAALQEQIIQAQQATLHELSAPLLPLADNVLALPLVGTIDSSRAQQIMETLLNGIQASRAALVIIDLTGVKMVDTQVAQALIRTAQAARLLGTQVVLTGIQPEIAQTLVHLGADLSDVTTRSTLQAGITYALKMNGSGKRT